MSPTPLMVFTVLFLFVEIGIAQEFHAIERNEDLHFEYIGEGKGLSNGYVTSIIQDDSGFMWFGTASGLNRFDGYDFKVFLPVPGDSNSLSERIIWNVEKSRDGTFWLGTQNGLNHFDPATERFKTYVNEGSNSTSLSNNYIKGIHEDRAGNLWVGTGNGLNRLRPGTEGFDRFFFRNAQDDFRVWGIAEDQSGTLWFGARDTLYAFNASDESFVPFGLPPNPDSRTGSSNYIRTLYADRSDVLWIGTEGSGLIGFDVRSKTVVHHLHSGLEEASLSGDRVLCIKEDRANNLWIGSSAGLHILNPGRTIVTRFEPDPFNLDHTKFDQVWSIEEDRAGNMWLGVFQGGIKVFLRHQKPFSAYYYVPGKEDWLPGNSIRSIVEIDESRILISISGSGVYEFDPLTRRFAEYPLQPDFPEIYDVFVDTNKHIWYSTTDLGVWKVDEKQASLTRVTGPDDPCYRWVTQVYEDSRGVYWIGTQEGLCKYLPETNELVSVALPQTDGAGESINNAFVWVIFEDEAGDLWFGTYEGLNRYRQESGEIRFFPSYSSIISAINDSEGRIWVGVNDGVGYFDPVDEVIKPVEQLQKHIDTPVSGMVEDAEGRIWISTIGLYMFDPESNEIDTFNQEDGLASSYLNPAIIQASDSTMYVGSWGGFTTFRPQRLFENSQLPPVKITNISLFNKDIPIKNSVADSLDWASPLEQEISRVQSLSLAYWQNDLTFEFAALDFTAPENNLYQFKLEGYDSEWIQTDASRRFAHYTNMDPGEYTFYVQASNNDGLWNREGAALKIKIGRPWWTTWWAIVLYGLFILGSVYATWENILRRIRLRNQLEIEHIELEKMQELNDLQTRFFVNVSHEIRTPLTLMIGPVQDALNGAFGDLGDEVEEQLHIVRRNGNRLHKLINELLDLASFEAGAMKLHAQKADLLLMLKATVLAFSSRAEKEDIELQFHSMLDQADVYFDREKMEKVMTNLLSNAFKFTPSGGKIQVSVEKERIGTAAHILLKVKDTGEGIEAAKLPHIFDRFYQADDSPTRRFEGSGIGLALTKDFVELHGGTIDVESEEGSGTCFFVRLPEGKSHLAPEELIKQEDKTEEHPFEVNEDGSELEEVYLSSSEHELHHQKEHTILIVEDNVDVRSYLKVHLQKRYHVLEAVDGVEGYEIAQTKFPDLIISDVMMPRMDGNTLCNHIKSNPETSFIPVVLLTARVSEESRIDGLTAGADDYIFKPFNARELLART